MEKHFTLNHQKFTLRYLGETDIDKYVTFFNALNQESIRCRFGHLISNMTASAAKPLTNGNSELEKAVIILNDNNRIVAIGRCHLHNVHRDAEIAIVVSESMRRMGLGRILLDRLIEIAKTEHCTSLIAYIATKNAPVISLLQSAGFVVTPAEGKDDLRLYLRL